METAAATTRYLITVAGPLNTKDEQVARALGKRLQASQVYSCRELFDETRSLAQIRRITEEEIGEKLDSYSAEYLILYGQDLLSVPAVRTLSKLRIYVEADAIDITSSALQEAELSGRKETLSSQVKKILETQSQKAEEEAFSSRKAADIIISADETPDEAVLSVSRYVNRTDSRKRAQDISEKERKERIDRMLKQYRNPAGQSRKAKIKRKLWVFVIKTTLAFKRLLDIVISLTALVLLSPLLIAVALIIKLTDGGKVFYVQTRIGKQGKPFPFPKFRSMVVDADKLKDNLLDQAERKGDVTFKMKKDPRVTPIGRFIRRFSIDELPQIWCVLIGDMSIVGPRPPVPREVALYTQEDRRRLEVTPGLTGIWQVSGRSDIGFKQQVELDVLYIESHGFLLDLKLILKTIPAVLSGKGAY